MIKLVEYEAQRLARGRRCLVASVGRDAVMRVVLQEGKFFVPLGGRRINQSAFSLHENPKPHLAIGRSLCQLTRLILYREDRYATQKAGALLAPGTR